MLHYVFTFLAHDVVLFFDWVVHDRGRYLDLYMFLVSHCLLIYIYEVIHDIYLYFVLCEIKKLFFFHLYFPHVFMRLLSVSGNIQVDSIVLLSILATDR